MNLVMNLGVTMKLLTKLVCFIFFILTLILTHEMTHYVIFLYFGCEKFLYKFIAVGCVSFPYGSNDILWLAHSINDIIGYNVLILFSIWYWLKGVNNG
jgi:hypothetical protein